MVGVAGAGESILIARLIASLFEPPLLAAAPGLLTGVLGLDRTAKQVSHVRTGVSLFTCGSMKLCFEQPPHIICPQDRQWCRLVNSPNPALHILQLATFESGCHTGAVM